VISFFFPERLLPLLPVAVDMGGPQSSTLSPFSRKRTTKDRKDLFMLPSFPGSLVTSGGHLFFFFFFSVYLR